MTTAANEAEDILEHFMYEHIQWHHKSVRKTTVQTTTDVYDFRELKIVTEEIESIAGEAAEIKSRIGTDQAPLGNTFVDHSLPEDFTVGLEEDMEKIMHLVCEGSYDLKIIPITGMGGIGKTTLARNAYNHARVKKKFHVRVWVTVSRVFEINDIFALLLESLKEVDPQIYNSSDVVRDKIYSILNGRNYLIVVDDLWSTRAWDDIKRIFPRGINKGSRVVITTTNMTVALRACSSSAYFHVMKLLNGENSWILLKRKAFIDKKCPIELKKIGQDICNRCWGLPLAIVIVAGFLSNAQQNRQSWDEIAKDLRADKLPTVNNTLPEDFTVGLEEDIDKISHSFDEKNDSYKSPRVVAIAGMGGIGKTTLARNVYNHPVVKQNFKIRTWLTVTHDFKIDNIISCLLESLKDVGPRIWLWLLMHLVRVNLALVSKRKFNGRVKICNVHDLIRDMSRRKAEDENMERRLSIGHPDLRCDAKVYGSTLRSVACFQPSDTSLKTLRKLRLLRVLNVVDAVVYSLPDQVFDRFHLRYLAFGCPMELPTAISRLQNLRTLIIHPSKRFRNDYSMDEVYLPLEIWSLSQLRDLISFFDLLPNPDGEASPLVTLLTLSVVKKLICTKELMKMIPNIKKLGITYFGDKYQEDYQLQNLELLHHLEKLKLVLRGDPPEINPAFPKTLRKLTLSGWRRRWEDLEVLEALPNLQVLKLRDYACKGDTWETIDEQFPSLEYLLIHTSDLEFWYTEKSHFPSLKCLVLYRCYSLREILDDIGNIATLELLEVDHASKSLVKCVGRIQKEQEEEYDNKTLRVELVHI